MERFSSGYQKAASRKKFSKMQKSALHTNTNVLLYIHKEQEISKNKKGKR